MDVRAGYKQTEVGIIPEEWEVVTAMEACDLIVDCKNRTPPVVADSDFAVVRTTNVRDGKFIAEDLRCTDEDSYREWTARAVPQVGDVLITREAPLGEVCAVPKGRKICLGQRMMLYRPSPGSTDSSYLLYALMSTPVRANLLKRIGGSTVGHAKVDDIRFLQFARPPLREQRAIAEALTDSDALLTTLAQLIAKKRDLKHAAMQQLLTGRTRLPGFQGKWELRCLGEVLTICHGKSQHEVAVTDGPFPILATGGRIGTASRPLYDKPSVLIGRKGTINAPQYMDTPFWTVDTLFYSAMKGSNSAKFFYYRFCLIDWMQYNEASGVPSLNARTIGHIEIALPEPSEQVAIAALLSDMDAELGMLEARRDKTQALKQAMMQELLTGRTRLMKSNPVESEAAYA